jgi:hypothetical protein
MQNPWVGGMGSYFFSVEKNLSNLFTSVKEYLIPSRAIKRKHEKQSKTFTSLDLSQYTSLDLSRDDQRSHPEQRKSFEDPRIRFI